MGPRTPSNCWYQRLLASTSVAQMRGCGWVSAQRYSDLRIVVFQEVMYFASESDSAGRERAGSSLASFSKLIGLIFSIDCYP